MSSSVGVLVATYLFKQDKVGVRRQFQVCLCSSQAPQARPDHNNLCGVHLDPTVSSRVRQSISLTDNRTSPWRCRKDIRRTHVSPHPACRANPIVFPQPETLEWNPEYHRPMAIAVSWTRITWARVGRVGHALPPQPASDRVNNRLAALGRPARKRFISRPYRLSVRIRE